MVYSLFSNAGYTPTHGSSIEYCAVCRFYKKGYCSKLIRVVSRNGWCRFFRKG